MKILFFLINMNLGGTEKSFLNLIDSLPKEYEIDLLLLENYGALLDEIPDNVNVSFIENHQIINQYIKLGNRRFGYQQLKKGRLGLFFKSEIQYILGKLNFSKNPYWPIQSYIKPLSKKHDISVAYAGVHNFIAYYTLEKTKASKKVLWIHFDIDKVIFNFYFGKKYYNFFDQIFCVAENAATVFKKRFPATKEKVFTFNNIINRDTLLKEGKSGESYMDNFNGLRILTLGRLSKEKGQLFIPQIVKKLKEKDFSFRWYLIGEGNLNPLLSQEIIDLSIEEELILLGSKMNPYGYLRNCDIYVQTSFYEGDPVVLREAKVFNRPIVTTNFLSAANLINNREDGIIVEISVEGLYQGVKSLLENADLRNKFSKSTINEIDYKKHIDTFLALN